MRTRRRVASVMVAGAPGTGTTMAGHAGMDMSHGSGAAKPDEKRMAALERVAEANWKAGMKGAFTAS